MSIKQIYIIPKNPPYFNPNSIDDRITNHIYEYSDLYSLFFNNTAIVNNVDTTDLYRNILYYYDITIKDIYEKYFFDNFYFQIQEAIIVRDEKMMCFFYKKYFFEEIQDILNKNYNKPQIVYFEEDSHKIKHIFENLRVKPENNYYCFDMEFYLPSNDILIFDRFSIRKKNNLNNIHLIYG